MIWVSRGHPTDYRVIGHSCATTRGRKDNGKYMRAIWFRWFCHRWWAGLGPTASVCTDEEPYGSCINNHHGQLVATLEQTYWRYPNPFSRLFARFPSVRMIRSPRLLPFSVSCLVRSLSFLVQRTASRDEATKQTPLEISLWNIPPRPSPLPCAYPAKGAILNSIVLLRSHRGPILGGRHALTSYGPERSSYASAGLFSPLTATTSPRSSSHPSFPPPALHGHLFGMNSSGFDSRGRRWVFSGIRPRYCWDLFPSLFGMILHCWGIRF
jgi:hypothetical protein